MIRPAEEKDLFYINDIYNQAVLSEFETGDVTPVSMQERMDWFANHPAGKYPVFVFEKDQKIYGWLSFTPYRFGRDAFACTAEISYYIDQQFKRLGAGTALLEHAVITARELHFKTLVAIILEPNTASTQLLRKFDFVEWGYLPGIAYFNGKECGHLYYGRRIN